MNIGVDFEKFIQQAEVVTEQFTRVPNFVFDELMGQLSDKAFKCLMVIIRQTTGYNREWHQIATSQFQKHTGISKERTIFAAIRELEQCNLIKVERKTGVLNNYSLTNNHYPLKAVPLNDTTTPKGHEGSTPKGQGTTTPKGHTNKENSKYNIKESIKEKFSFATALENLGADEQLIKDWLAVRKNKKAANTETAFKGFEREFNKANLNINTVLKICIERSWQGFNASWLQNINLAEYQEQVPTQTTPEQPVTTFKGVAKKFKGMNQ